MKRVEVAVGAIVDQDASRVLLAQRPPDVHQGGLWEFPGGKLEAGETVLNALQRELREELQIEVGASEFLLRIDHDYADKQVSLDVRLVTDFIGEPQPGEGQPLSWVEIARLHELDFPQANAAIVEVLQLRYLGVHREQ